MIDVEVEEKNSALEKVTEINTFWSPWDEFKKYICYFQLFANLRNNDLKNYILKLFHNYF